MTLEGKPCHSACSTNPALEATFMVYEYDTEKYSPKGHTGLLKTDTTLLVNVTGQVSTQPDKSVLLDLSMVTALTDGYDVFFTVFCILQFGSISPYFNSFCTSYGV